VVLHMRMKVLRHVAARDLKPWFGRGFAKGSTILVMYPIRVDGFGCWKSGG